MQTSVSQQLDVIKPKALPSGGTIGIFTPSWPAHLFLKEKYQVALDHLSKSGWKWKEGTLTAKCISQGYRTASPRERAQELMELILDDEVDGLMATIGGWNSSSLIPYLDYQVIREKRKILVGYSDITALHLAILHYSRLSTFYGPTLVPVFGEKEIAPYTFNCFKEAVTHCFNDYPKQIKPPLHYNRQFIDASQPGWQEVKRVWQHNEGWKGLSKGEAHGGLIIADLETLLSTAGTPYFPDMDGMILLVEQSDAPFGQEERRWRQLERMGVLDLIVGLIISKPFNIDTQGSSFNYDELILETIGNRSYPIVSNFDCGHTFPMLTLGQLQLASLLVNSNDDVHFYLESTAVE